MAILAAIGAAVDYTDLEKRHSALQNASDAALLAAVSSGETELKDLRVVAENVFEENFQYKEEEALRKFDLKIENKNMLALNARLEKPTYFMKLFGNPTVYADVDTAGYLQSSAPLDIALVLDRTGSMAGTNLAGLTTAATQYISDLEADNKDVRIAVIPFSNYVNVGVNHADTSWLDLPVSSGLGSDVNCSMDNISSSSCPVPTTQPQGTTTVTTTTEVCGGTTTITTVTSGPSGTSTSISSSSTGPTGPCTTTTTTSNGTTSTWSDVFASTSGGFCTFSSDPTESSGSLIEECRPARLNENWFGCVGSRPGPYNVQAKLSGQKFPLVYNRTCGQPMTQLSSSLAGARQTISSLTASGGTYIPSGLQWGWRVLDPDLPFEIKGPKKRDKLLILMTDGENTQSQSGSSHEGRDHAVANALTQKLCDSIKADDINIATVSFSNGGNPANSQLLRSCASTPTLSFTATNAQSLKRAFESATDQMNEVRLIR
ncbi:hypothetical protein [Litorimonas sp. WD9-15]|uniref:hypothetical protein n=1 Tax=Litorimonas sp. WD9-15 TaxID=3418716 RepID=UPI003D0292A0